RNKSHRSASGLVSGSACHLSAAQTTTAVKNEDMPYTSASTALNQKESVNAKASAPTAPLPTNKSCCTFDGPSAGMESARKPSNVMLRPRNSTVPALLTADR